MDTREPLIEYPPPFEPSEWNEWGRDSDETVADVNISTNDERLETGVQT